MSRAVAAIEPNSIQAGNSVEWDKSLADFPATLWTLRYYLIPAQALQGGDTVTPIVAAASSMDYQVRITAATTAAWLKGKYTLVGYVSDSDERFEIYRGPLEVLPDLTTETQFDNRTYYERLLDKIREVIENGLVRDVIKYTWAGQQCEIMTLEDAFKAEERILSKIQQEAAGTKQRKILTRFLSPR